MTRIKHSKYKNTGILFELLIRQTTADVLNENNDSVAVKLIKKYFGKNTTLARELQLYRGLTDTKFNSEDKAKELIQETIDARKKISTVKLRKEKYELIKEIKNRYDIESFFSNKIPNYKSFASIYQLFEAATNEKGDLAPFEIVKCRHNLIEYITGKTITSPPKLLTEEESSVLEEFQKQNDDLRALAYKIMLDKFNEKYNGLEAEQKALLREYIYNVSDTKHFREYVDLSADKVKTSLLKLSPKIDDKAIKIKVDEVIKHIEKVKHGKVVKESQILQLMRYYELLREIKKVVGEKK